MKRIYIPKMAVKALVAYAKRTPDEHLPGYMNRYWVIHPDSHIGKRKAARIHEILRSDMDRHLHTHPGGYTTVILDNGYTEVTHHDSIVDAINYYQDEAHRPSQRFEGVGPIIYNNEMNKWEVRISYGPGSVLRRPAGFAHRLVVPEGTVVTTLFMMDEWIRGEAENKWGFWTPEGFVDRLAYLEQRNSTKRTDKAA